MHFCINDDSASKPLEGKVMSDDVVARKIMIKITEIVQNIETVNLASRKDCRLNNDIAVIFLEIYVMKSF